MAVQSSRGRRSRQSSTARSKAATKSSSATSVALDDKAISHDAHHRMIARMSQVVMSSSNSRLLIGRKLHEGLT